MTKGGENVKLGLIEVNAIPLEQAKDALQPVLADRKSALANLSAQITAEEKKQSDLAAQNASKLPAAQSRKAQATKAATGATKVFNDAVKGAVAAATQSLSSTYELLAKLDESCRDLDHSTGNETSWGFTYSGALEAYADSALTIMKREEWKTLPSHNAGVIRATEYLKAANRQAINAFRKDNYGIAANGGDAPLAPATRLAMQSATNAIRAFNDMNAATVVAANSYTKSARETLQAGLRKDKDALDATAYVQDSWPEYLDDAEMRKPDSAIEILNHDLWKRFPERRAVALKAAAELKTAVEQVKSSIADVRRLEAAPSNDAIRNLWSEHGPLARPELLFSALPAATHSAKSDADGRCRLLLPASRRWVVAAIGNRNVPSGEREEYIWIVEIPEGEDSTIHMSLSNDSLLTSGENPIRL